jgi:hypothetical protein
MIASDWALLWSLAFWKLIFRIFTHIVTTTLLFVTRLAEVSVAPTKPLSYTTTKFAFELNEIFTVFGTILNRNITTSWTNQLLWLKRTTTSISLVHGSYTIFPSSKVWLFALKAQKVCIDDHCILLRLTKIRRCFIC